MTEESIAIPILRVPQARILRALMPDDPSGPRSNWPTLTRPVLAQLAGYTPISGSVTRALVGIREGSSSGDPHLGVVQLELVRVMELNMDGVTEINYRITPLGIAALHQFLASGGKLPPVRDPSVHTNNRYLSAQS